MTYPAGMSTITVRHKVVSASGRHLKGNTVTAVPAARVFGMDGSIVEYEASTTIGADGTWELDIPQVDQPAIRNKGVPWMITEHVPGEKAPKPHRVAPTLAHGPGPVDLAEVLVAEVTSKAVTIQAGPVTDTAAADLVNRPGGAFATVLKDTIGTETEQRTGVLVPPLVSQALYDDDALRAVAESTVELAAEGLDIMTRNAGVAKGDLVVNVRDYGAKGDDSTDDTAAIQAALNAGASLGSRTVYIPGGRYMIRADNGTDPTSPPFLQNAGGVSVPSRTHLELAPDATLVAIPTNRRSYEIVRIYDRTDVTISGGSMEGEKATHTGTTGEWGYGIAITAGENVTVRDVTLRNCWGDGVNIQQLAGRVARNVLIEHVRSIGHRRQGMSIEGGIGIRVQNCVFADTAITNGTPPGAGVDIEPYNDSTPVEDITFRDCLFLNNEGSGLLCLTEGLRNITVTDCTFTGNRDTEAQLKVHTDGGRTFRFRDNRFTGSVAATIRLAGGGDYVAEGNTCDRQIYVTTGPAGAVPKGGKIARNTLTGPTTQAGWVYVAAGDDISVEDNDIDGPGSHGIRCESALVRRVRVRGNAVRSTQRGVFLSSVNGATVDRNELDNNTLLAVEVSGGTDIVVERNQIAGACLDNGGQATINVYGTPTRVTVQNNEVQQDPRITPPTGAGTGRARYVLNVSQASPPTGLSVGRNRVTPGTGALDLYNKGLNLPADAYIGEDHGVMAASSARRPTTGLKPGTPFFDTTLGKQVNWNGTAWVDATGATA